MHPHPPPAGTESPRATTDHATVWVACGLAVACGLSCGAAAGVSAQVAGALLNQSGEPIAYYSYDELKSEGGRKLVRSAV